MTEVSPYPVVYGNEEEMSLRVRGAAEVSAEDLKAGLAIYRARQERNYGVVSCDRQDSTGGGMYIDKFHPERCTPTYRSPAELATRIQSNEPFSEDLATIILQYGERVGAIGINRRNIDSDGNTFACHDNMGVSNPDGPAVKAKIWATSVGHALTRGVIVGAGYNGDKGIYFAQKAQGLGAAKLDTYGYSNSAFRVVKDEGSTRVEYRSSDTNISWDSTVRRLGINGIALSVAQTPLTARLGGHFSAMLQNPRDWALRLNRMPVNKYGEFVPSRAGAARRAVNFQLDLYEIFMSDAMAEFGPQPEELMAIARDAHHIGELTLGVLKRELSVDVLMRLGVDWAAKHKLTMARLRRDSLDPEIEPRIYGDQRYRIDDLGYDYTEVRRDTEGAIEIAKFGLGYILRDGNPAKGRPPVFPTSISPEDVRTAGLTPPEDTRDGLRARLLSEYVPVSCDWKTLRLAPASAGNDNIKIDMEDVLTTQLSREDEKLLRKAKKREPAQQG